MNIDLLPTLQVQRELYAMPRNHDRFLRYLEAMTGGSNDIVLPITAANPMGKEHCLAKVDELLAFDAERVTAEAIEDAKKTVFLEKTVFSRDIALKLSLVLVDDLMGGWTNREANEFSYRAKHLEPLLKRPFVVVPIWTSEPWGAAKVREATLVEIYRTAHLLQHGDAISLRDLLAQEGTALAQAGVAQWLDADDLNYTREVITPHFNATDQSTQLACLMGDSAAKVLGYPLMGLSKHAGLALALNDAMQQAEQPKANLK